MRVLWISFLLFGSIACGPVQKYYDSDPAGAYFIQPRGFDRPVGGSSLAQSDFILPKSSRAPKDAPFRGHSSLLPQHVPHDSASHGSNFPQPHMQHNPSYPEFLSNYNLVASPGSAASHTGGSAASQKIYFRGLDESLSPESATSEENAESFTSDVTNLDPVYSSSSRSRYLRGRLVFGRTQYIPGEPFPPVHIPFHPEYRPAAAAQTGSYQVRPAAAAQTGSEQVGVALEPWTYTLSGF